MPFIEYPYTEIAGTDFRLQDKNVEVECIIDLKICPVKSCCHFWFLFLFSEQNSFKLETRLLHADWEVNDNFKLSTIC
jgi:hypothetical protein